MASEILKGPYHFDFLSMKEGVDERAIEEGLVARIPVVAIFFPKNGLKESQKIFGSLLKIFIYNNHLDFTQEI